MSGSARHVHAVSGGRRWHRESWGPLGTAETLVKSAAFLAAYVAFARSAGSGYAVPHGSVLAEVILLGIAELTLLAAIADRVMEREITAMVFIVCNTTAHLALIWALLTTEGAGSAVIVFAGLMLTGELVKIGFLVATGYTVRSHGTRLLVAGTSAFAGLYAVLAAVALGAGPLP
jgi:hypothetical protein